ncbi:hypothetical protein GTA08_BOTSDO00643 [Neofusicoccum parvum]|uniref:Uncharacterized protein n=1 Tax=Neofusicoccum parvum TaxID=310453 RepID=A0ACB5SDM6_9PEZI|nr:hypothetical protein GTA08_BOTSDO00643 [Neofusicoccum parvum]
MSCRGALRLLSPALVPWLAAAPALAQDPLTNDDGLFSFVTRPEIRAPKLDVRVYDRDAVAPGYWFVAPYNTNNAWEAHGGPLFETCQVGPAIYDGNGDLIWSGACLFDNMNAFDFRPVDYAGKKYLSLNIGRGTPSVYGAGVILSDTYEVVQEIEMSGHTDNFNQHEFSVLDDGKSVLYVAEAAQEVSAAAIGLGNDSMTWIRSNSIKEESLMWGDGGVVFEWDSIDHIPLNESTFPWPEVPDEGRGWDYMHMNSIDKFPDGDYLVSMRYSNSLFRISGENKTIVWRIGGPLSDFEMQDGFHFSRQHHARIITTNSTHTIITLMDNAAGSLPKDEAVTAPESSALIVQLHHAPSSRWTASIIRRFPRPDGDHSHLRGSVQILSPPAPDSPAYPSSLTHLHDRYPAWSTSNLLAGWSAHGYTTEFTPSGAVVAEIRFGSSRFDTYRAYKHAGFVGRPTEPPVIKAFAFGDVTGKSSAVVDGSGRGVGQTMTVAHVSWNGATEVAAWRVYGRVARDGGAIALDAPRPRPYGEAYGLDSSSPSTIPEPEPSGSSQYHSASPSSSSQPDDHTEAAARTSKTKRAAAAAPSRIPSPSDNDHDNPLPALPTHLGTFPRAGFETTLTIPNLPVAAVWAEALAADGAVLGRTATARVVVPGGQRPYAPGGGNDAAAGDWVFAAGAGFIALEKDGVAERGWGYAARRGQGGGVALVVVLGVGAAAGVGAAVVVLVGWWGWVVWVRGRAGAKGKGKEAKGKGKYRAVAADEEGLELAAADADSSDGESEDEYLGQMSWAPVLEAVQEADESAFDEEMTLGEVRRGIAMRRERAPGLGAGRSPLILQARNQWG